MGRVLKGSQGKGRPLVPCQPHAGPGHGLAQYPRLWGEAFAWVKWFPRGLHTQGLPVGAGHPQATPHKVHGSWPVLKKSPSQLPAKLCCFCF